MSADIEKSEEFELLALEDMPVVLLKRIDFLRMLRALTHLLLKNPDLQHMDRGVGVMRLVASGPMLLGLSVTKDVDLAVATSAKISARSDRQVDKWLDRPAVEAIVSLLETSDSDTVRLVVDSGFIQVTEEPVLWAARRVCVIACAPPSVAVRVDAAALITKAARCELVMRATTYLDKRVVTRVARVADEMNDTLSMRQGEAANWPLVCIWGDPDRSMWVAATAPDLQEVESPDRCTEAVFYGSLFDAVSAVILPDADEDEDDEDLLNVVNLREVSAP